jgi:hypothetical protein
MNWDHKKDRRLITGTGGSGKTTLFLHLVATSKARWKFCFDPEREIARKLGWRTCYDVPQMIKCAAAYQPVCFCPDPLFKTHEEGFTFFCTWVWKVSCSLHGVKLFASDEVQDFTESGPAAGVSQAFKRIMQKGRRQEINVLMITHSLGEAHHKFRAQLSHLYSFRHEDENPLTWLKKNGFDPEAVKRLTYPGGWICRNRDTGEVTTNEKTNVKPARAAGSPAFVHRREARSDSRRSEDRPSNGRPLRATGKGQVQR